MGNTFAMLFDKLFGNQEMRVRALLSCRRLALQRTKSSREDCMMMELMLNVVLTGMGLPLQRYLLVVVQVVMLGLDAAGKTTILYKLHIGEILSTVPTVGAQRATPTQPLMSCFTSSRPFSGLRL
jgi:hypothetical protein